jgi:hypothetical protein
MDEGSECGDANAFDYTRTSDEEGCGLADAFRQFEAQVGAFRLENLVCRLGTLLTKLCFTKYVVFRQRSARWSC